jgi:hypothetical protein
MAGSLVSSVRFWSHLRWRSQSIEIVSAVSLFVAAMTVFMSGLNGTAAKKHRFKIHQIRAEHGTLMGMETEAID